MMTKGLIALLLGVLGVCLISLSSTKRILGAVSLVSYDGPFGSTGPGSDEVGPPLNMNGNILYQSPQGNPNVIGWKDATTAVDPVQIAHAIAKKARMQELFAFNAAANDDHLQWNTADGHLHLLHSAAFPEKSTPYKASTVNAEIESTVAALDDQDDGQRGIFKSALTQKLFIVPQANVLSGAGQERKTNTGKEDLSAEKHAQASGAAVLITKAAKKVVMEKKKKEAREVAKQSHLGSLHTTKLQAPFNSGDWSHTGEVRIHWAGLCLFM
jgi:hypothetical protein